MLRSWVVCGVAAVLLAGCGEPEARNVDGAQSVACLPTERVCGASCVDVSSNAAHCGACGVACATGTACVASACVSAPATPAPCIGTLCTGATGNECASLSDDARHCGACNNVCAAGQICADGRCVLDCGALSTCNGACVDLASDGAHCGACGAACAIGKACVQSACACPAGLAACADACVDTALDPEHCGGCDQACSAGALCEGGQCVGPDGCTDALASGLALRAVDVYQAVQVPIMEQGAAIASSSRNADVVAGRRALFRVHVAPEAAWLPREVSARVELTAVDEPEPDQREIFFARLTPTEASNDADPSSTFQVMVPAEALGADTRYAVSLVECDAATTPAPAAASARFPTAGYEPLEARETGPLKVHIVPIGSPGPDVSEEALKVFKDRLEAVFPITEVLFTVGPALQSTATSMCTILGSISSRRSADRPAPDVYYYGLTTGILGGQSGCSNASPVASGSKVSVGWAQGFTRDDGTEGAATMCHELGHSHGRLHAPCNVQDPDRAYPYPGAEIGVWAYDFRTDEFYEPTRKDMMSYCPEPRWNAWISDYNYQAILERVIEVNALAEVPALAGRRAEPLAPWRIVISDSTGVHWVEEPLLVQGIPEGTPVRAVVHGAHGPMQQVDAYKQDLHDGVSHDAFMLTVPPPDESWRAIEAPGLLAPLPI